MTHEIYQNPLVSRYASPEMASLWSDDRKFRLWRRLWVVLAEAQAELGLAIEDAQLAELRAHVDQIDYEKLPITSVNYGMMSWRTYTALLIFVLLRDRSFTSVRQVVL